MKRRPCRSRTRRAALTASVAAVLAAAPLGVLADVIVSEEHTFRVVTVATGLDHPWGLAFLPDGRMLVTERSGQLRTVTEGRLDPSPIAGVPEVRASGQGGLLDVALHPEFREAPWVYLSYAAGSWGRAGTEVARGRLRDHRLEDVEVLFRALPKSSGGRHFGSRLRFAPGRAPLHFPRRPRGPAPRPGPGRPRGEHHPAPRRRHRPARQSVRRGRPSAPRDLHHREPQRAGPRVPPGDGLPVVARARAAGRRRAERGTARGELRMAGHQLRARVHVRGSRSGKAPTAEGMAQPIHQWTPSIAPSGLTVYDGDRFPGWHGNLFVGALSVPAPRPPRHRRRAGGARGAPARGTLRPDPRRADRTRRPHLPPHRRPRALRRPPPPRARPRRIVLLRPYRRHGPPAQENSTAPLARLRDSRKISRSSFGTLRLCRGRSCMFAGVRAKVPAFVLWTAPCTLNRLTIENLRSIRSFKLDLGRTDSGRVARHSRRQRRRQVHRRARTCIGTHGSGELPSCPPSLVSVAHDRRHFGATSR